ncbi:CocE/NonD family hydrolase [Nocardia vermiculata]|uniref:CocE/NonD family hydrolase n=1 Tax=Nocardia vermiculata TaxID=257274 RepID=A0A846XWG0_9NOCA|nr:CocE/NonD family hydrolase [Nocardia vermiculata]NKY50967.1 CocE/NonD family hydrolase [Nocardia vermiculata]
MRIERDATFTTADGQTLRADIYRPGTLPAPVIVQRTPYTKDWHTELGERIAAAGYIGIIQDVRGQNASTGEWAPFVHEADDGAATVEWASRIDGATGEVAMIGSSYAGTCALQAAARRPESLVAVVAAETPADYYDQMVYPGGAFALAFIETWLTRNIANSAAGRLPDGDEIQQVMNDVYTDDMDSAFGFAPPAALPALFPDRADVAPYFADWLGPQRLRTRYWDEISLRPVLADIEVPVLNIGGWYDMFVSGTTEIHRRLTAAGRESHLLLGPWSHNMWGRSLNSTDFGPEAEFDYPGEAIAWIDRCLGIRRGAADGGSDSVFRGFESPVRYFTSGDNSWHVTNQWPPADAVATVLRLRADGALGEQPGVSAEVSFLSDPADPVPAYGGHSCCYQPQAPMGPVDQRIIEARNDVVSFTMEASDEPRIVAGPVEVAVTITADVVDTDITAVLTDVGRDGTSVNLTEGVLRAGHRRGSAAPVALIPGEPADLRITLHPVAHTVLPGHRLRLDLAGSLFPTFERNTNTGRQDIPLSEAMVAHIRVHVGGDSGSSLIVRCR